MKYIIPDDRLTKIVFKYLDIHPGLVGITRHVINPLVSEFHKWTESDDEYWDLDPPFRYYEEDYSNIVIGVYPMVNTSHELDRDLEIMFGEENMERVLEIVKDWFSEKFNLPVKSIK